MGFPGETEEEFQDTVSLVQEIGYETIFAFKYSPRPFTKAAKFEDQVDEAVKTERLNRLFDAHDAMAFGLVKHYEGQVMKVLVEQIGRNGKIKGRTSGNKLTHISGGGPEMVGQMVDVRITKAAPSVFLGDLVQ
ncbi:(Dimethylallyl)adenosine tRNA methylthiotransferase MiaB [compost metagenome]